MTNNIAAMERIVAQLPRLHSSPHVAWKVLSLLQRNDFDIAELTELLKSDPALTTSILRLVNSSYFGISHDVSSLEQAVTLLGSRSLRLAVLSLGLLKQLSADTPARIYQRYWKQSLTMAASAAHIASLAGNIPQDVAYSSGLLSDIGVLALVQVQTDDYAAIYVEQEQPATVIRKEEELFGFNHTDLAGYMLAAWNFPEELCEAARRHHELPTTLSGLNFTVAMSERIATSLWTPDPLSVTTSHQLLQQYFGVDIDGFVSLALQIQQTVQENAQLLSVRIEGTIDCDALLATARRQYLDIAMESAPDI